MNEARLAELEKRVAELEKAAQPQVDEIMKRVLARLKGDSSKT